MQKSLELVSERIVEAETEMVGRDEENSKLLYVHFEVTCAFQSSWLPFRKGW